MHTVLRERLRETRRAKGYTQLGLAEAAGLSREAISLMERDTGYNPGILTTNRIAALLGEPHLFCDHCAEAAS